MLYLLYLDVIEVYDLDNGEITGVGKVEGTFQNDTFTNPGEVPENGMYKINLLFQLILLNLTFF